MRQFGQKVLAIPATSAPLEHLFSQMLLVLLQKRNKLNPTMTGQMVFVNHDIGLSKSLGLIPDLDRDNNK